MKMPRTMAGVVAGLAGLASAAAYLATVHRLPWEHGEVTLFFSVGAGVLLFLERLGLVADPYRTPAVLALDARRDPSRRD
jgi:hypothetical protein